MKEFFAYARINQMMKRLTIRRAELNDAEGIIRSHICSIREICSKDYTAAQIEAWAGRDFRVDHWHQTISRDYVWVIDDGHEVQGFGHLALVGHDLAELMGLYFSPKVIGQGLGKKMMELIMQTTCDHKIMRIDLHATLTARSFYEKFGFKETKGKQSMAMRGVDIPCCPMELYL